MLRWRLKSWSNYYGALREEYDENKACPEALDFGLEELLKNSSAHNLIIEGDNLCVIQWINGSPETFEFVQNTLGSILVALEDFRHVIYHIYEEDNIEATELDLKGAISCLIRKPEIKYIKQNKDGEVEEEKEAGEKEEKEVEEATKKEEEEGKQGRIYRLE